MQNFLSPIHMATMSTADVDTIEQTQVQVTQPKMWNVVLHNDDKTSIEFVVYLLESVFNKSHQEAIRITMTIHAGSGGIAGTYTKEVADEKRDEATLLARSYDYPLVITCEEE